jgi:hypothetical protein
LVFIVGSLEGRLAGFDGSLEGRLAGFDGSLEGRLAGFDGSLEGRLDLKEVFSALNYVFLGLEDQLQESVRGGGFLLHVLI